MIKFNFYSVLSILTKIQSKKFKIKLFYLKLFYNYLIKNK